VVQVCLVGACADDSCHIRGCPEEGEGPAEGEGDKPAQGEEEERAPDDGGCACRTTGSAPGTSLSLLGLAVLWSGRRLQLWRQQTEKHTSSSTSLPFSIPPGRSL